MTPLPIAVQAVLAVFVLIAAVSDFRTRTIPNWLTFGGITAGFVLNALLGGWDGLKSAASGFGVAALIFLPLFIVRFLGGGDVKIMAAVGALVGPLNLLVIFILDGIFAAIAAVIAIVFTGRVLRTLKNIWRILASLARLRAPYRESEELEAGSEKSFGLPRAVTLAAAVLLFLLALR